MRTPTLCLGLVAWLTSATWSLAAEPNAPAKESAAKSGEGKEAPTVGADGVRRDPNGVKGISPYLELINKGDRAYIARDFDGAIGAFREAVQAAPQNALGHYRLGAAQLAKGDQKEAEAAFVNGLRFVGKDASLRGKLLFALADLRERQKNSDEAIGRWKEYAKNAEESREAVSYPATATERLARNEGWKQISADSAAVKDRITKRLKEAEDAARKSAADPKNK